MIQKGQERIAGTLTQAENAGGALAQITDAIGQMNSMTMQIATAAEEQSTVVANISGSVTEIEGLARSTLQDAERTSGLTGEIEQAVAGIVGELHHFHLEKDAP